MSSDNSERGFTATTNEVMECLRKCEGMLSVMMMELMQHKD